jgi:hypothetical protein
LPLASRAEVSNLTAKHVPQSTAGIDPERFSDDLFFAANAKIAAAILCFFLLIGLGLRMNLLGAESLGEDELNKLQTVEEYRNNGLSGKNGEHPFLMKGMQTVSMSAAERINSSFGTQITEEGALRFPVALFGTFTALLLYLFVTQLFGRSIGLITAILWTIEPMAVGFDRIAKEDSLALFFLTLTFFFWVRSQSKAERGDANWLRYVWLAGCAFAAMMASKYYPYFLGIPAAYYIIFQQLPGNRWALGRKRWLIFCIVMGVAFLILNPTVLFPDTWREMLKFSSEGRIGHDSYEYMGVLYGHKMTNWLRGVPWTFYYVFIAVKTSLPTLAFFLAGIPFMFKRRLGDGRFFIAIWAFIWFVPYSILGGKFTRYFTVAEPIVLIVAAVGLYFLLRSLKDRIPEVAGHAVQVAAIVLVAGVAVCNSLSVAPHYRLFTNSIGTHFAPAGSYFPHDEIYDGATREVVAEIAQTARTGAVVASETPGLIEYYAAKAGRPDLRSTPLSDPQAVAALEPGDVIVETKGRRYFSNEAILNAISKTASGTEIKMGETIAAEVFQLDAASINAIKQTAAK